MGRTLDTEEHRETLLRTTADVMAHALVQMECCAQEWPSYADEARDMRSVVERMISNARQFGYVAKTRI